MKISIKIGAQMSTLSIKNVIKIINHLYLYRFSAIKWCNVIGAGEFSGYLYYPVKGLSSFKKEGIQIRAIQHLQISSTYTSPSLFLRLCNHRRCCKQQQTSKHLIGTSHSFLRNRSIQTCVRESCAFLVSTQETSNLEEDSSVIQQLSNTAYTRPDAAHCWALEPW